MAHDLPPCPEFDRFYRVVNGRDPFPWQSRLAEQVRSGDWPSLIGIPTGLGKTSCLEVAVWALAAEADLEPEHRTAPTRIWWVVNRRLLVDDTFRHAERLGELLMQATEGDLHQVAERLRSLSSQASVLASIPLQVIRLRGGVGVDRPNNPAQPAVICTTIPMYGSRVLFRGYGSSRSTRPIDAALAYTDSLVICDEAHLARHLAELFAQLVEIDEGTDGPVLPGGRSRPKVVALTATGDHHVARFDLDCEDLAQEVVRKRYFTRKPVKLVSASPTKAHRTIANHLAKEVENLLVGRPAGSCLVFVNTPATARAVLERLKSPASRKRMSDPTIVMLTGRLREREANVVRKRVLDTKQGVRVGHNRGNRDRHLIVVATQTLEVGADLDARYLVTEACGVRALTQRLGRLNRLGQHEDSLGVYVHIPPTKGQNPQWPVYGHEPTRVFEHLLAADPENSSIVDLSPARLDHGVLGVPGDHRGRAPCASLGLLHEWVQSSAETPGEAPVEPFFSGLSELRPSVQIVWRAHLPGPDMRLWPPATDQEAIEIPIGEAHEGLSDVTALLRRVTPDGIAETVEVGDGGRPKLHPGWTIVVQSNAGKMDEYGWNPEATDPVVDLSVLSHGLPLDIDAIRALYSNRELPTDRETIQDASNERNDGEPVDRAGRRAAADRILVALSGTPPPGYGSDEWEFLIAELNPEPRLARKEVSRLPRRTKNPSVRFDASDELCAGQKQRVGLGQHGMETAVLAKGYAAAIGVNRNMADVLSHAARWHDTGKADTRFQEWLRAGEPLDLDLLAKSDTPQHQWERYRARAGWPRGGRHEALSGRLVSAWLTGRPNKFTTDEADLLVHLVVSHHGHGRPIIVPVEDSTVTHVVTWGFNGDVIAANADLSSTDWEQPRRFAHLNRLHGYWGLALLEAIVRQADWASSGSGEVR